MDQSTNTGQSDKEWLTTLLLCLFLGGLGYTVLRESRQRVAMLLTCGGLGIWSIIDLVMIATDLYGCPRSPAKEITLPYKF